MIQYLHSHYYKVDGENYPVEEPKTYAFELPDYDTLELDLLRSITDFDYTPSISFRVGIARLHPNDTYVKVVGRAVAEANMVMVDFTVNAVKYYPEDNEIIIYIRDASDKLDLKLVLKKEYRNVRILAVL